MLKKVFSVLFNLLFPITCIACGAEGKDICDRCVNDLHPAKKQQNDWVVSMGNYHDETMRKIMWHIKKMPNRRAVVIIAHIFAETIQNRPGEPERWMFIPVPITRKRFRERGFNQCEILGKALSEAFGLPLETQILVKTRHTAKQGTAKSKEERMTNLSGSFAVRFPERVHNKYVIIVDDITTTGSTLIEVRETLLAAGAARVMAWTVAN